MGSNTRAGSIPALGTMKKKLEKIRVVRCLIESDVSIKDAIYEEYFDNPGYFYLASGDHLPNGIGLPFDLSEDDLGYSKENSWIKARKVEVIETIPFTKSKWFPIVKSYYEEKLKEVQLKYENVLKELKETESVVNAFH